MMAVRSSHSEGSEISSSSPSKWSGIFLRASFHLRGMRARDVNAPKPHARWINFLPVRNRSLALRRPWSRFVPPRLAHGFVRIATPNLSPSACEPDGHLARCQNVRVISKCLATSACTPS